MSDRQCCHLGFGSPKFNFIITITQVIMTFLIALIERERSVSSNKVLQISLVYDHTGLLIKYEIKCRSNLFFNSPFSDARAKGVIIS